MPGPTVRPIGDATIVVEVARSDVSGRFLAPAYRKGPVHAGRASPGKACPATRALHGFCRKKGGQNIGRGEAGVPVGRRCARPVPAGCGNRGCPLAERSARLLPAARKQSRVDSSRPCLFPQSVSARPNGPDVRVSVTHSAAGERCAIDGPCVSPLYRDARPGNDLCRTRRSQYLAGASPRATPRAARRG